MSKLLRHVDDHWHLQARVEGRAFAARQAGTVIAEIEEKQEEPSVEKQSAATTKNRNSGTKKEEEKKNRKGWGIGDLFKNAVDKVGEGIDKALKDEQ